MQFLKPKHRATVSKQQTDLRHKGENRLHLAAPAIAAKNGESKQIIQARTKIGEQGEPNNKIHTKAVCL